MAAGGPTHTFCQGLASAAQADCGEGSYGTAEAVPFHKPFGAAPVPQNFHKPFAVSVQRKRAMGFPTAASVGIIIYQSRLMIHRPVWCWLGWRVRWVMGEFETIAAGGGGQDRVGQG